MNEQPASETITEKPQRLAVEQVTANADARMSNRAESARRCATKDCAWLRMINPNTSRMRVETIKQRAGVPAMPLSAKSSWRWRCRPRTAPEQKRGADFGLAAFAGSSCRGFTALVWTISTVGTGGTFFRLIFEYASPGALGQMDDLKRRGESTQRFTRSLSLPVADAAGPARPGLDPRIRGLRIERIAVTLRQFHARVGCAAARGFQHQA